MGKWYLILLSMLAATLAVGFVLVQAAQDQTHFTQTAANIVTSRTSHNGLLNTSQQGVFGPAICQSWGDPFSPFNTRFLTPKPRNDDNTYSHTYRIRVPQSYRDNHRYLQVELFDPDSINQDLTSEPVTMTHSAMAQSFGLPDETVSSCNSVHSRASNRWNPCLLETGEFTLTQIATPTLSLDDVNLLWFVRVDENRGTGVGPHHGNGRCESRASYEAYYNTATQFDLYYFREGDTKITERINLSSYTGQVSDGIRDNGAHNTDLRWVTPGVTDGVPVDLGQPFLLDLQDEAGGLGGDVAGIIVDPETGDMDIYLDVTTLSGGSENGFEIWAGPPVDPAVPDNVNERNLYLLNNPGSHDSAGVMIYGLQNLPQNSNWGAFDGDVGAGDPDTIYDVVPDAVKRPLIPLTSELAGQTITVTLYDVDAGAMPPIVFTIDTIPEAEWSLTFGLEDEGRCFEVHRMIGQDPYSCGSEWIEPSYLVAIPETIGTCPDDCQPFRGGHLEAAFRAGRSDTFFWDVQLPPPVPEEPRRYFLPLIQHASQ